MNDDSVSNRRKNIATTSANNGGGAMIINKKPNLRGVTADNDDDSQDIYIDGGG
jgi:hypothetical protein